jgi:hypothetical protein
VGFRTEGYALGCRFKQNNHPDFNEVGRWAESKSGRAYARNGFKNLVMDKELTRDGMRMVDRGFTDPLRNKRNVNELNAAASSGMLVVAGRPLKTPILRGFLSHRNQAINAAVFLDTGNLGRTLIKREVVSQLVEEDRIRKHDITYHVANREPMHSSGSIELDVKIIFDEVTKDIEHSTEPPLRYRRRITYT